MASFPLSKETALAHALKRVIGGALQRSGLGLVWLDDRTWTDFARQLSTALDLVILDRETHTALARDAKQMAEVRRRMAEYNAIPWQGKKS